MSGASERAKGRASGPVLTSRIIAVLNHSARVWEWGPGGGVIREAGRGMTAPMKEGGKGLLQGLSSELWDTVWLLRIKYLLPHHHGGPR